MGDLSLVLILIWINGYVLKKKTDPVAVLDRNFVLLFFFLSKNVSVSDPLSFCLAYSDPGSKYLVIFRSEEPDPYQDETDPKH